MIQLPSFQVFVSVAAECFRLAKLAFAKNSSLSEAPSFSRLREKVPNDRTLRSDARREQRAMARRMRGLWSGTCPHPTQLRWATFSRKREKECGGAA